MEQVQAKRTTESALMEVHFKLQGHGKMLTDCAERLRIIGNKLVDDSGDLNEKEPVKPPGMPGIITNLNNDCDGFYQLIADIDRQLKKIEPLI